MKKVFLVNFKEKAESKKVINVGGGKYDNDLLRIFNEMGFTLEYYSVIGSIKLKCKTLIRLIIKILITRDTLYFFRYPFIYWNSKTYKISTIYQNILFKVMKISRNKIGVIISDLDFIRNEGIQSISKEIQFLRCFDYIIVHNQVMADLLINNGIDKNCIVNQKIGNNLTDYDIKYNRKLSNTIVFSGNLSKSKFLNKLAKVEKLNYKVNLYGIGFSKEQKSDFIIYKGCYSSEEIVKELEGSFGLIWDGDDICKCSGLYGEYTRINNPSKFSQYISAGLPIIAWEKSAVANVVKKYNIGFVINDLIEIGNILNKLTEKQYQEYWKNVIELRKKVISGYHFKKVIQEIITDL